jgi:hypothetical protein
MKKLILLFLVPLSLFSKAYDIGSPEAMSISYVRAFYSGDIATLKRFMPCSDYKNLQDKILSQIGTNTNFRNSHNLEFFLQLDNIRSYAQKELLKELYSSEQKEALFQKVLISSAKNINYHNPQSIKVTILEIDRDLWGDVTVLVKIFIDNTTTLHLTFELEQTSCGWSIKPL